MSFPLNIGSGTYGSVSIENIDGMLYAVKSFTNKLPYKYEKSCLRILASKGIAHPQVFRVDDDKLTITMELLSKDLDWMIENKVLNKADILRYVKDILEILVQLHSIGFIHGDIKPNNICLTGMGKAQLIDYGFMLRQNFRIRGRTPIYTPYYRHPEIYNSMLCDFDYFTCQQYDMWSLGITILELVVGEIPLYFRNTKPLPYLSAIYGIDMNGFIRRCMENSGVPPAHKSVLVDLLTGMLKINKDLTMTAQTALHIVNFPLKSEPYFETDVFENLILETKVEIFSSPRKRKNEEICSQEEGNNLITSFFSKARKRIHFE